MKQESGVTKSLIYAAHKADLAKVMWNRGDYASEVLRILEEAEEALQRAKDYLQIHTGD